MFFDPILPLPRPIGGVSLTPPFCITPQQINLMIDTATSGIAAAVR